jgi:hypothetical protein
MGSNDAMYRIETDSYTLIIFDWDGLNPLDDNVDVEVQLKSGERYFASFFTIENLRTLMKRHEISGECNYGTYIRCPDMVVAKNFLGA